MSSSLAGPMMREVLHALGNIDFDHELALSRLEAEDPDQERINSVRTRLLARHHARREPYVEVLAALRRQQHRVAAIA